MRSCNEDLAKRAAKITQDLRSAAPPALSTRSRTKSGNDAKKQTVHLLHIPSLSPVRVQGGFEGSRKTSTCRQTGRNSKKAWCESGASFPFWWTWRQSAALWGSALESRLLMLCRRFRTNAASSAWWLGKMLPTELRWFFCVVQSGLSRFCLFWFSWQREFLPNVANKRTESLRRWVSTFNC